MKKKKISILLFAFCIVFAFVLVTQFSVAGGKFVYVSASVLDYYATTITGEQDEVDRIRTLIEETRSQLREVENLELSEHESRKAYEDSLVADVNFYGMASGSMDVQGPGITITIDDGDRELAFWEDPNDILVHDSDLLKVIKELWASGAEAISINGQRIISSTSISCSGYTVRINGQTYARPFVIRAIGDSSRMSAALIGPGCYGTILKDCGLLFQINVENSLTIYGYSGDRFYRYLDIVDTTKEGEDS